MGGPVGGPLGGPSGGPRGCNLGNPKVRPGVLPWGNRKPQSWQTPGLRTPGICCANARLIMTLRCFRKCSIFEKVTITTNDRRTSDMIGVSIRSGYGSSQGLRTPDFMRHGSRFQWNRQCGTVKRRYPAGNPGGLARRSLPGVPQGKPQKPRGQPQEYSGGCPGVSLGSSSRGSPGDFSGEISCGIPRGVSGASPGGL